MPNHISNKIIIKNDNAKEIIEFMNTDEVSHFDFNKLIPMDPCLDIESSTITDYALIYFLTKGFKQELSYYEQKRVDHLVHYDLYYTKALEYFHHLEDKTEFLDLVKKVSHNYTVYGVKTWYDWATRAWSTKWNSYESAVDEEKNEITFETAWCEPRNVLNVFIDKFKFTGTIKAVDEGWNFWFIEEYENGILISERQSIKEDLRPLLTELRGYTQEDFDEIDAEEN